MKQLQFSLSTIVGIVLGFLLIGFAFAFTPPTQTPPEGNVAPPLNTSSAGQEKQGGLILNTGGAPYGLIIDQGRVGIGTTTPGAKLEVSGAIKLGGFDTKPTCDLGLVGTLLYSNTGKGGVYFCTPAGWRLAISGQDADGDGASLSSATDCDDADPTVWQILTGYTDNDGDGYAGLGGTSVCSGESLPPGYYPSGSDCYDLNNQAFPGQTTFFSAPRGDPSYDYNCDGAEQGKWSTCNGFNVDGYLNESPGCGNTAPWYTASGGGACAWAGFSKTQVCR